MWRGELAALSSAVIWAASSAVYARLGQRIAPLTLNLIKGIAAIGFMGLTLALRLESIPQTSPTALGLLLLSGAVGIGLGDTAFFISLNCLGARRGLLLEALAPPLAAVMAWVALGERLPPAAWLGIALTVGGVAWVIVERAQPALERSLTPIRLRQGIFFGSLAALSQAGGAVLSRAALADTGIPPLWSGLVRIVAGCAVLLLWLWLSPTSRANPLFRRRAVNLVRLLLAIAATAFASTFLAIWLQQTALKYTAAGIAQAIGATSPMFIIPIAIALGEQVSWRAILGAGIALGGVWLLFMV